MQTAAPAAARTVRDRAVAALLRSTTPMRPHRSAAAAAGSVPAKATPAMALNAKPAWSHYARSWRVGSRLPSGRCITLRTQGTISVHACLRAHARVLTCACLHVCMLCMIVIEVASW